AIIGNDGRVRVFDFGLARTHGEAEHGPPPSPAESAAPTVASPPPLDATARDCPQEMSASTSPTGSTPTSGSRFDSRLTRAGSVLGTPRYMAPEQHLGQPVDARADQFTFCVALYSALYGELPFAGSDPDDYRDHVLAGRVREAPAGARVPRRMRAVLLRGL